MLESININDIRDWFSKQQAKYNWSYASLARIDTGYSESGLKKAIKEGTIKYEALIKIISEKGLIDELNHFFRDDIVQQINTTAFSLEQACIMIASNPELAMENKIFKNFVTIEALKLIRSTAKNGTASIDSLLDNL